MLYSVIIIIIYLMMHSTNIFTIMVLSLNTPNPPLKTTTTKNPAPLQKNRHTDQ